jgi:hypothetical protein
MALTVILCMGSVDRAPAQKPPAEIVVLCTPPLHELYYGPAPGFTTWRCFQTWSTDVARLADGRLLRVDHLDPREDFSSTDLWQAEEAGRKARSHVFKVKEARETAGSLPPPADWPSAAFDDGTWIRHIGPIGLGYASIAAICLRGKFEVADPLEVEQMRLVMSFQGGAVAYLNGQEIGRAYLPPGKLTPETLAEDYPLRAYVNAQGNLIDPSSGCFHFMNLDAADFAAKHEDADLRARYRLRTRQLAVTVPRGLLRKGMNVLAIEVRRAAAHEAMFTRVSTKEMGYNLNDQRTFWWNRADVQSIRLTAQAGPGAIVPAIGPPPGTYVSTLSAFERPAANNFAADPYQRPVLRLAGARNGKYSGQIVISSSKAVRGVTALAAELRAAGGATIPASAVRIRYALWYSRWYAGGYETLESAPPAELLPPRPDAAAVLPLWVTIDVPRGAKAGDYAGRITVAAEGLAPADVPVQLHVSGWTVPEPRDFAMYLGFIQSPQSLAIRYNVPMWSEEHWRLVEKSLDLLGQLGNRELTIPLIRRTHFGNEHGMVRWVRQSDGSRRADLSIAQRYLDLAQKHFGTIGTVLFYISEAGENGTVPWISEWDPARGAWIDAVGPKWGTPESRAFWKPVFDELRAMLARRGLAAAMAVGLHAAGGNGPVAPKACIEDLKEVAPEARWARLGHGWFLGHDFLEKGPNGLPWGRVALVGYFGVYWNPAADKPLYGWRNPAAVVIYPRDSLYEYTALNEFRMLAEATLLSGTRRPRAGWGLADIVGAMGRDTCPGIRGMAPMGADFWPVLTADGKKFVRIIGRYNDPTAGIWDKRSSWSTTTIDGTVTWILGDARDGPAATTRFEALRESLEEAEARVYLQNILLDEQAKGRLPPELARRCDELCNRRTRLLGYWSELRVSKGGWFVHHLFDIPLWQQESRRLYDLAAEVETHLGPPASSSPRRRRP